MVFRQVIGLLTAVFMLHLNVAAIDAACGTHGTDHDRAAQAATMAGMHMSMASVTGAPAAPDVGEPMHPCDTPAGPSCCRAMVSCAPVYVGSLTPTTRLLLPPADFRRVRIDVPLSRLIAPEPPPPRA